MTPIIPSQQKKEKKKREREREREREINSFITVHITKMETFIIITHFLLELIEILGEPKVIILRLFNINNNNTKME